MSAELPLSTRTLWTVLLATTARITKGSSWGCWHPSKSESEKVMDVLSRGSLDTAYTSAISADLMLRRWAFLAELDSRPPPPPPPLQILLISRGFLLKAVGAELLSFEVVVVAAEPELGSKPDSEADFQGL